MKKPNLKLPLYYISLSPDRKRAASVPKRSAKSHTATEITHIGSHAYRHRECGGALAVLHDAPACLLHCQKEEKWSMYLSILVVP